MDYGETLPTRERVLLRRLEGFGDIVFGFAVSNCALQLPTLHGHVDLHHWPSLLVYFATFVLLARLWLSFHELMSGSFRPTQIDLAVAFTYLAFVTLVPYAMYSMSHQTDSLSASGFAVAEYAVLFTVILFAGAVIAYRNLLRGVGLVVASEQQAVWYSFVRRVVVGCFMVIILGLDLLLGPTYAFFGFVAIVGTRPLVRATFGTVPTRYTATLM